MLPPMTTEQLDRFYDCCRRIRHLMRDKASKAEWDRMIYQPCADIATSPTPTPTEPPASQ